MLRYRPKYLLCFTVIILCLGEHRCISEGSLKARLEQHQVKWVVDGDTIQIDSGEFVRYIGIDTPEMRRKKNRKWIYEPEAYAKDASRYNKQLLKKGKVYLEYDIVKRD
ncbi:MAG: thermonuclease family protein, partial [Chlamydiota bacterium]|nr:thermonuclease family protein [Chlamydiota bacterium]